MLPKMSIYIRDIYIYMFYKIFTKQKELVARK